MIVIDVLLAANLILFVVCAVRAPGRTRPSVDALLAQARVTPGPRSLPHPAAHPAGRAQAEAVILPFASPSVRRARALHPSAHHHTSVHGA